MNLRVLAFGFVVSTLIMGIYIVSSFNPVYSESTPVFVSKWGTRGLIQPEFFTFVQGVAVDSSGNVYVTDQGNTRVQKFDSKGNYILSWGKRGIGEGEFHNPYGIDVYSKNVYVVDNELNRIEKFDLDGHYINQWGTKGSSQGKFLSPQDVAVDGNGNVYVADTGNGRIQKFDSTGKFRTEWKTIGNDGDPFLKPRGVAVDDENYIYVSDSGRNKIFKFTSDGEFEKVLGKESALSSPQGITIDSSSNLIVADTGNHRMVKMNSNGKVVASWGSEGFQNGNFYNPRDVEVGPNKNIFVADSDNHRIQKFGFKTNSSTQDKNNSTVTSNSTQTTAKTSIQQDEQQVTKTNSDVQNDKEPPQLSPPSSVTAEASDTLTSVSLGEATATDQSGIASIENNSPEKFPLGTTVVTWTAKDNAGNTVKATQKVTVVDTTSPVISAPPNVTVEAENASQNYVDLGEPSTYDAVGISSVVNDAPVGFEIGKTVVTWTAYDDAGNTATSKQVVVVEDTTKPEIKAPEDVVVEATNATGTRVENLSSPIVTDNGVISTISNDAPDLFKLGETKIVWKAEDESGNIGTDTQTVTVVDTTPPEIDSINNVVREATSQANNTVELEKPDVYDVQHVEISNDAPETFEVGTYMITWNATDISGNTATAIQNVTITDSTPPRIVPPNNLTVEANSTESNVVSIGNATAEDATGVSKIENDAPPTFPLGNTVVQWKAVDNYGNEEYGNQTIELVDTTKPKLSPPDDIEVEATDPVKNSVEIGNPVVSDAVGIDSIVSDAPEYFGMGTTIVNWTATDTSGNQANATQKITVVDTTKPNITAPQDIKVEATSANGTTVDIGNATAEDAVGIDSVTNNSPPEFSLGETVVTWEAMDTSGNLASAKQTVTVVDTTPPEMQVPDNIVYDAVGMKNTISLGKPQVNDLVDSAPVVTNNAPSEFSLGETVVTWTAKDRFGNSVNKTQAVSVQACGEPVSYYNLIEGSRSDDTLSGTELADLIFAKEGNDIIFGGKGNDCILAGPGDDIVYGDEGNDTIYAGPGDDIVKGRSGNDSIYGQQGTDVIDGGYDKDHCEIGTVQEDDTLLKCET